jgi:hypothetical protein
MYPTNVLRQGAKVEVVVEGSGGWLAIRPPQGSFSWVSTRYLQPVAANQPTYVVAPEGAVAEVHVGSSLVPDRPDVIGARLQRGAQVRAIGPERRDRDGGWLPIEAPPGELRYIPASAVARTPPATQQAVAAVVPAPGTVPAAPPAPPTPDALWRQAQQAERAGQTAEAIRLYQQAGTANLSVNPNRAMEAFDRARWLDQAARSAATQGRFTPAPPAGPPSEVRYAGSSDHLAPVAADPNVSTVRLAAPNAMNQPAYNTPDPTHAPDAASSNSSGRGWLHIAGRAVEGRRTYRLENAQGLPLFYVAAQPGVDLESYVNREVELFGPVVYNGLLRANFMTAVRVQPVP